jgi:hypothetical protein
MSAATMYDEKPQRRKKIEFDDSAGELGYLLAGFLVPIPLAFILAYFYGILRFYVGFYIVWYFCILGIGAALSYTACSLLEKGKFSNSPVVLGYLLFLGTLVLYTAWATTITWAVNTFAEDMERQLFTVEVLIRPDVVFQGAVEISMHSESTGRGGRTTPAAFFMILEAVFMAAAPLYMAYKRYNEGDL